MGAITRADPPPLAKGLTRCYECALPLLAMRRAALSITAVLLMMGCQRVPSAESQRLERLELRVQQLEQRQATPNATDTADQSGKPPAGPVKSLTFRTGSNDDRLRIYWADGTLSNLPCTKEQNTWACG
jgi:hypothetical protein